MYVLNFHATATPEGVMAKVVLGLLAAFLATVLAARVSFFVSTSPDDAIADEPWSQNEMEFVAWNGERWTAWIRDGAFEHTPENPDRWSRHSNSSLAFIGWEGEAWQAKIDGEEFVLAHHGDWQHATERATAIRYRDWTGKHQLRSLTQLSR
jgi:hypothetical protein